MSDKMGGPTPMWVTGAINSLMEGTKDSVISSTKDALETSKKGDSPGTVSEPPKVSLQPMSEIVAATGGNGSYLQMAATTSEAIKAVLASHKETLEETSTHLHDHDHEAPKDMLEEVDMMLKGMCASMKGMKAQHDKPNGIQIVNDSQMRIHAPTVDMGGQNVSLAGNHGQLSFETQSTSSRCAFNWHQISMQDVKFVHHNYQVRNAVVGTDSKSGVSSREYFNEISSDAAHSISSTTKLHSIQASDIEEKGTNITSRAISRQDVQAGEGYTLSVGQGTAKGAAPHFFMAGGVGAAVAQKALSIGLSKVGGEGGLLGGLVGNATPGVVIRHTPKGSSYVSPEVTNLLGKEITNVTGLARRVVHGEAVNIANRLLADVSKGVKLEGVAGGVLTMLTKKFSLSMSGWMGELINKVIGEVTGCMVFPELPSLPEVTLPRVPQMSCMPPGEGAADNMKMPPSGKEVDGDSHKEGVHSDKYPVWLEDALQSIGMPGKVSLNQEGIRGTDGKVESSSPDPLVATFGAPLMIYKSRAPVLGTESKSSGAPIRKGSLGGGEVDLEMKLDGVPEGAQAILQSYASGGMSKIEAVGAATAMGVDIIPYMDRPNAGPTRADSLGVGGVSTGKGQLSLSDTVALLGSGKSMAVGDVMEAVLGQIPGVSGESVSLEQALQDLGLGGVVGRDGTLESAELLSMVMDKAGLHLPQGLMQVKGDTVSINADGVLDNAIDKAVGFLGDMDPLLKVDRLLKAVGLGTPLTNLLNDLSACAKSWINIRAILKLPDIALDSISGKLGKIKLPGVDLDFLKDWSLCGKKGGSKDAGGGVLWDGVQRGQAGYGGGNGGTA